MEATFKGKIQIDVASRLKPVVNNFKNPDIYISDITIDSEKSDSLPTDGYYNMTSSCTKGSVLSWEPLSKTFPKEISLPVVILFPVVPPTSPP